MVRRLTALLIALAVAAPAAAQVVTPLPIYGTPNTMFDLGNGPIGLHFVQGNARVVTSSSTGTGSTSGSATLLTLTATSLTPPCVGCNISGPGLTTQTASAVNGSLITLSAAATVPSGSALAWGAACPSSIPATPALPLQGSVGGDFTFYTQARVCGYAAGGIGAAVLPFATGAH